MDYYASLPSWKVPKWIGATLGGIFSLIVILCVGLIIHLTRPPRPLTAPRPLVATATTDAQSQRAAGSEAVAESPLAAQQLTPAAMKTRDVPRTRRRAILARHDAKPGRQAKSDFDRLLGL
jgi:hypothetical protein